MKYLKYFSIYTMSIFLCVPAVQATQKEIESELPIMGGIDLVLGDITKLSVDAIVNAANEALLGGGGVDGAIHKAAGAGLLGECKEIGGAKTGEAVITGGYELNAPYVIHTVGPIWSGGKSGEADLLRQSYRNSFRLVKENKLKSVAFPAISAGVYGYPLRDATTIALQEGLAFSRENPSVKIVFVCFDESTLGVYQEIYAALTEK